MYSRKELGGCVVGLECGAKVFLDLIRNYAIMWGNIGK